MKKLKCRIMSVYHGIILMGMAFAAWKIVRVWQTGLAEKTGHTVDASLNAAAKKLEKTAIALEAWSAGGVGENLGKGVDEILMDTKKTLEKATTLVAEALNHKKQEMPL
jgi:hypothetical protein